MKEQKTVRQKIREWRDKKIAENDPKLANLLNGKERPKWVAQPGSQVVFLSCPVFECLYQGTRGGGKTDALLMDFLKHVGMGWGAEWHGIIFRKTFPELADIIKKSKKWFPILVPGCKYNSSDHKWTFPDGEVLLFRFIEREEDYDRYHGWSVPFLGFEELTTWADPAVYLKMQSCVRSTHEEVAKVCRIRSTANPLGPGHGWVKRRFQLGGKPRVTVVKEKNEITGNTQTRCSIPSHLKENKIMLKTDPLYVDRLYQLAKGNEAYIQAWIHGSWDIVAGGMFDDIWNVNHHVVENFEVPASWTITTSFDWGSTKPASVGWWAQSDGTDYIDVRGNVHSTVRGDLFRIAEWYIADEEKSNEGLRLKSTEIAKGIIERELAMGIHYRVKGGWADPAIFASHDGDSIGTKMAKYHLLPNGREYRGPQFRKADNARIIGWESVRTWLYQALPGPEGAREKPGLFICKRCHMAQKLIPVTQRNPKKPDDVDTDTEDHLQDELRYRVKAAESGVILPGTVPGPNNAAKIKNTRNSRVLVR